MRRGDARRAMVPNGAATAMSSVRMGGLATGASDRGVDSSIAMGIGARTRLGQSQGRTAAQSSPARGAPPAPRGGSPLYGVLRSRPQPGFR